MKILLVNKYAYLKGGTERYLFNLKRLLESKGHTCAVFSMNHPENPSFKYDDLFLPNIDYSHLSLRGHIHAAYRTIWYREAGKRIGRVLDTFKPDVVHLLNIYHQISPSILPVIHTRGIPIVQTLNDYKLICPNYLLYTRGDVCHRCDHGNYLQAVMHRCLHDRFVMSFVATLEMYIHKSLRIYERMVNRFIAPSSFMLKTMISFGISSDKLSLLPYFFTGSIIDESERSALDNAYALYFGRLSHEKGLFTLLKAQRLSGIPLIIAGDGPLFDDIESYIEREHLEGVRLIGFLDGQELTSTIRGARFTVVPSEWHEVFGQVILESFAQGIPVIATDRGGMPEVIEHEKHGILVPPGKPDQLADVMKKLWRNDRACHEMGLAALKKVRDYNADDHYDRIIRLYKGIG